MFQMDLGSFLIRIPALLITLTFHEYAHGKMADYLGDPTARYQGRLSLNPLEHLDPIGLLMLWLVGFGWAKPVQVNPMNFRGDKKKGMMLVAAAGPGMNLFMALVFMYVQGFIFFNPGIPYASVIYALVTSIVTYNIFLAVFNLVPVPPLDGSKILAGFLPYRYEFYYRQLEQFGPMLLLLLIFTGMIRGLVIPAAYYIQVFMSSLVSPFLNLFA